MRGLFQWFIGVTFNVMMMMMVVVVVVVAVAMCGDSEVMKSLICYI